MEINFENGKYYISGLNFTISNCITYPEGNSLIVKNFDHQFFDNLKIDLVSKVYHELSNDVYGFQKTICCLEEFYCNPVKNNYLKINKCNSNIPMNEFVELHVNVLGIWFSDKSWGPFLVAENVTEIKKNSLFIDDSDSDSIPDLI